MFRATDMLVPPDDVSPDDTNDDRDVGVFTDSLGIPRLAFRTWSDYRADGMTGAFVVLHGAVVWDLTGRRIERWSPTSEEAALAEALAAYGAATAHPAPEEPTDLAVDDKASHP